MKNIIPPATPASASNFKQTILSFSGFLLLLIICILSSVGNNKVSSKNASHQQCSLSSNISSPSHEESISPAKELPDILYRSEDGGKSWKNLSKGLPADANISQVYTQGTEMFIGTFDGIIYHSNDMHKGEWTKENIGTLFRKESITGIFAGKSGPYVSVSQQGIYKRITGTAFWQPLGSMLFKDITVHDILETSEGIIYVAAGSGIYKSADEGNSWKHVFTTGWVSSLASAKGLVVASALQGILYSADGLHWKCTLADEGAVYKTGIIEHQFMVLRLADPWSTSPRNESGLSDAGDNRLQTSADSGKTWKHMNTEGLNARTFFDFVPAGKYLFSSHNDGISRSADGGKTWELVRRNSESKGMTNRIELCSSDGVVYALVTKGGC